MRGNWTLAGGKGVHDFCSISKTKECWCINRETESWEVAKVYMTFVQSPRQRSVDISIERLNPGKWQRSLWHLLNLQDKGMMACQWRNWTLVSGQSLHDTWSISKTKDWRHVNGETEPWEVAKIFMTSDQSPRQRNDGMPIREPNPWQVAKWYMAPGQYPCRWGNNKPIRETKPWQMAKVFWHLVNLHQQKWWHVIKGTGIVANHKGFYDTRSISILKEWWHVNKGNRIMANCKGNHSSRSFTTLVTMTWQ